MISLGPWEVDPFVKGSLGLSLHDFGGEPSPDAVVEFAAASAAA
jgi:hypothetical protein